MEYLDKIVPNIMETVDVLIEAVNYVRENEIESCANIINDIGDIVDAIIKSVNSIKDKITLPNKIIELHNNIVYSYERMVVLYEEEKYDEVRMRFNCEFMGLILTWEKYLNFFLIDGANEANLQESFNKEKELINKLRKKEKKDEDREYKYDVSVVMLFYNNLNMTKECYDNLIKYTEGINYEIITVNNGSDEESCKWHNALPHAKKVDYKYNMGPTLASGSILDNALYTTEGRYTVLLSNDVIVTTNWLNNLYACINNNEDICWASPLCNSLSNNQTIDVNYKTIDEMHEFAKKFNVLDKGKWQDRARLFTFLAIMRPSIVDKLKLFSPYYFCYDMFADDDASVKIRRAGYRQVLCKDTFVHHYGSATIKEGQFEVMDKGREQFFRKYGVDGWESLSTGEYYSFLNCLELMNKNKKDDIDVLAINPMFGETLYACKNKLKENGFSTINIDTIIDDERYLVDAKVFSRDVVDINSYISCERKNKYDLILIFGNLEEAKCDIRLLLKSIKKSMNINGYILFAIKNPFYYKNILKHLYMHNLLGNLPSEYYNNPVSTNITTNVLRKEIEHVGLKIIGRMGIELIEQKNKDKLINDIIEFTGIDRENSVMMDTLSTVRYCYIVN